jgi:RNA polymerase sigma-70 factor (ECF subfamily)
VADSRRSRAAATPAGGTFDAEALTHLTALQRASTALAPQRADAEDLVQDAYMRALRSSGSFQPGTNLRAWLFTILRNVARNRRRDERRRARRIDSGIDDDVAERTPSGDTSPEQRLLNRSVAPQLRDALESMPKALRDAVWLRDVEEMSYADIARRLRIPLGTVMSRISRGRRLLHDRLAALDSQPAPSRSDS